AHVYRGGDLAVEHEIGPVTDHHDDFALRLGEFHAQPSGDLVAHAGEAVLQVIARGLLGLPVLVQLPGQAPRGADQDVGRLRSSLHRTDDLGVRWQWLIARGGEGLRRRAPAAALRMRALYPGIRSPPLTERLAQLTQPLPRVRDQRHCTVLAGVHGLDIERHYPAALRAAQGRRARRKVLQTRA